MLTSCGAADRPLEGASGTEDEPGPSSSSSSVAASSDGTDTTGSTGSTEGSSETGPPPCNSIGCPLGRSYAVAEPHLTPAGPAPVMFAGFGSDTCSGGNVVFVLSPTPLGAATNLGNLEGGVRIILRGDPPDVYEGTYAAVSSSCTCGICDYSEGELEFLEPFERRSICEPDAMPRIHARADFHDAGWDFTVELEATYCYVFSDCIVPCE